MTTNLTANQSRCNMILVGCKKSSQCSMKQAQVHLDNHSQPSTNQSLVTSQCAELVHIDSSFACLSSCLVDQSFGWCHEDHNAIFRLTHHPVHAEGGYEGFATGSWGADDTRLPSVNGIHHIHLPCVGNKRLHTLVFDALASALQLITTVA